MTAHSINIHLGQGRVVQSPEILLQKELEHF
jgi:hypothetical protein